MLERFLMPILGLTLLVSGCSKSDDDDDAAAAGNFTLKGSGEMSTTLANGLDPVQMMVKVYGFAVSKNQDCSDMTVVLDESSPSYVDFLKGPTLVQKNLADGEYPCVAFTIGDVLKFTPVEADGKACEADKEYDMEICRDGAGGTHADGTAFTCTEGKEEKVTFYVSTLSKASGGSDYPAECKDPNGGEIDDCNGMKPPTTALTWRGFKLAKALTVAGATTGHMVIDGTGKVGTSNTGANGSARCGMEPPAFGFQ